MMDTILAACHVTRIHAMSYIGVTSDWINFRRLSLNKHFFRIIKIDNEYPYFYVRIIVQRVFR